MSTTNTSLDFAGSMDRARARRRNLAALNRRRERGRRSLWRWALGAIARLGAIRVGNPEVMGP